MDRGVFGCASTPCGLVSCAGDAIFDRCTWPWATNIAGDGIVSRSFPRWSGIDDTHALRPTPLLG